MSTNVPQVLQNCCLPEAIDAVLLCNSSKDVTPIANADSWETGHLAADYHRLNWQHLRLPGKSTGSIIKSYYRWFIMMTM